MPFSLRFITALGVLLTGLVFSQDESREFCTEFIAAELAQSVDPRAAAMAAEPRLVAMVARFRTGGLREREVGEMKLAALLVEISEGKWQLAHAEKVASHLLDARYFTLELPGLLSLFIDSPSEEAPAEYSNRFEKNLAHSIEGLRLSGPEVVPAIEALLRRSAYLQNQELTDEEYRQLSVDLHDRRRRDDDLLYLVEFFLANRRFTDQTE